MEIGITAELQKKLGIKDLPKPTGDNLFFCWDAKLTKCGNKNALLLTNTGTRYAIYATNLPRNMGKVFCGFVGGLIVENNDRFAGIVSQSSRIMPGVSMHSKSAGEYLRQAGGIRFTKTHGRKAVGQLCNADESFAISGDCYDPQEVLQYPMMYQVNRTICHCIGYDEYICPNNEYEKKLRNLLDENMKE